MTEVGRLLISLALAGAGLTLLGAGVIWSMDESRRIRRSLTRVLGEAPHALAIARGRGKGAGFNFTSNQVAVTWDAGAWCLIYRLEELVGAELAVDGQVLARVYRGEPRRALDLMRGADTQVRLRLVFDEPRNPDFVLDLWLPEDETRKDAMNAAEAIQEGNRWIARVESLLRRPAPLRAAPMSAASPHGSQASPRVAAKLAPAAAPASDPPPWDDDDDDEEEDGPERVS
jgi:hypothetical protein